MDKIEKKIICYESTFHDGSINISITLSIYLILYMLMVKVEKFRLAWILKQFKLKSEEVVPHANSCLYHLIGNRIITVFFNYELPKHFTESEKYKAVILRIDSPGGDALASDL